jgi:hypothetical protein
VREQRDPGAHSAHPMLGGVGDALFEKESLGASCLDVERQAV